MQFDRAKLETLAEDARPKYDADWGSVRQTIAFNLFFDTMQEMGFNLDDFECMKASQDDMIDEALKRIRKRTE